MEASSSVCMKLPEQPMVVFRRMLSESRLSAASGAERNMRLSPVGLQFPSIQESPCSRNYYWTGPHQRVQRGKRNQEESEAAAQRVLPGSSVQLSRRLLADRLSRQVRCGARHSHVQGAKDTPRRTPCRY